MPTSLRASLVALSLSLALTASAQDSKQPAAASGPAPSAAIQAGSLGLSAELTSVGSGGFGLLYFLAPSSALHLNVSADLIFVPAAFDFGIGIGYRMYLGKAGPVAGWFEPGLNLGYNATAELFLGVGAGFGLDYFFSDRLSVGVNASVSFDASRRFSVVGISTASSGLNVTIYF